MGSAKEPEACQSDQDVLEAAHSLWPQSHSAGIPFTPTGLG